MSADMSDGSIKEGFLCPICMKDLVTVTLLQEHFENQHSNEDRDLLDQLKGLFGKAKKKLLSRDSSQLGDGPAHQSSARGADAYSPGGVDPLLWEPQQLGATRAHTNEFCKRRDAKVDRYAVETNKLLIRLDKLIDDDVPSEPRKRKAYEKKVVSWAPDCYVNLCTTCGRQFTLGRRRHHCRLCGTIVCDRCSQFLPFTFAAKLTNPSFQPTDDIGFLRRSDSSDSLNSLWTPDGERHLRVCGDCRKLLERHDQMVQQRRNKSDMVLLYEKLQQYIHAVQEDLPKYEQMAESLGSGEMSYQLPEAETFKMKLGHLYQNIDAVSKRLATMGGSTAQGAGTLPQGPQQRKLQAKIRQSATSFLQETLLGLTPLPSASQLKVLQEKRQLEIQQRIAKEREHALELQRKQQSARKPARHVIVTSAATSRVPATLPVPNKGWTPSDVVDLRDTDDPMVQQMMIIKNYIKQAQDAHRTDEVTMLTQNLADLQQEYTQQQGQAFAGVKDVVT